MVCAEEAYEVVEVGGMESEIFRVHVSGDVVGGLFGAGNVMDMDVNVVVDAVGSELGSDVLHVWVAAPLPADIRDGHLGVHAEEDRLVMEAVCEGAE